MHGGMHRWERLAKANVLGNCLITYFFYKISLPVPLQPRWIESVEHTLQTRLRERADQVQSRPFEPANGFEDFFAFRLWPNIRPNDTAHFFHVQRLGKRWTRRNGHKGKEAIQIVRSRRNYIAIPLHYIRAFAQFIQHRPGINRIDWMQLECKSCYDPEVPASTAKRPKQIGILFGIRFYEFAVGQHHVGRKEIINA